MKKKFASLFLVMALVLTMIPASAFANTGIVYTNTSAGNPIGGIGNTDGVVLSTDKAEYELGDNIYLKVEGATNATDDGWIGIYDSTDVKSDSKTQAWAYTEGTKVRDVTDFVLYGPKATCYDGTHGAINTELAAGRTYYIIHMASDGRWAGLEIRITGGPVVEEPTYEDYDLELVPEEVYEEPVVNAGESFTCAYTAEFPKGLKVKVTAPADAAAELWVGIYPTDWAVTGTSLAWATVKPYATVDGSVVIDLTEIWDAVNDESGLNGGGNRKLVLFADGGKTKVADTETFFVRPNASNATVKLSADKFTYNGKAQAPEVSVVGYSQKYWTVTMPENTVKPGTYTVDVDFHGTVGGHATAEYTIEAKNLADEDVFIEEIADVVATGSAIEPFPVVTYSNETTNMLLKQSEDFTVTYGENTKPGKGTVTITGIGNYIGSKTVEFNILEKVCNHVWDEGTMTTPDTCEGVGVKTFTCTLDKNHTRTETVDVIKDHAWDAGTMTKADTCTEVGVKTFVCKNDGSHKKTENVDVIKDHAWDAGTVTKAATCKAEGVKTFVCKNDGSHKKTEKIAVDATAHVWGAEVVTPATCTANGKKTTTCTLCTAQKVAMGDKATGHKIVDIAGKDATCTATGLTAGKKCSVCGTWTLAQGTVDKVPHTVAASTVTKKATAKADGVITNTCACGEVVSTDVIAKPVVSLSKAGAAYTGKVVKAPVVRVKDANGKTIAKDNYTVVAPKNVKKMKDIGRYAYTIKFKGDTYTGSVKVNFEIKPAKTKIKAPAAAKKAITVKWTKAAKKEKVTGYEVMYATNNKFTKGMKTVTVKGAAKVSKKVTKLKSKTKYFVKVRSYKTVKGVKVYSDWSAVKSIKAK